MDLSESILVEKKNNDVWKRELLLLIISSFFVFISAIALSLSDDWTIHWQNIYAPTAWLLMMVSAYLLLHHFMPSHDPYLLPIVGLLTGWGFILINRLAPNFLERQVIWLLLGVAAMLSAAILPKNLRFLRRYRYTWVIFGIGLLAATLIFGVNPSGQGAALWLKVPLIGQIFFQPSELLKLLFLIFLASYFDEKALALSLSRSNVQYSFMSYLAPLVLMWGFCILFLVWQRDLGAATLFFIVFLALLFIATGEWRALLIGMIMLILAGIVGYYAYSVVALRIDTWVNPWLEANSRGYQIVQSLYAIASGSIIGQGVAQGFPNYIPVVHSDFIFSAIVEEWGLIGSFTVIVCFALIVYRGFKIALTSRHPFSMYLASGIALMFGVQALLIMGGVTKILPLTGVTLQFVSYGGSSLLVSCVMIGLLLNLSDRGENLR